VRKAKTTIKNLLKVSIYGLLFAGLLASRLESSQSRMQWASQRHARSIKISPASNSTQIKHRSKITHGWQQSFL